MPYITEGGIMKIEFWCTGKTDETYLNEGVQKYCKRLINYIPFDYKELILPKSTKTAVPDLVREEEKKDVLKRLKPGDFLVLLDDRGKGFASEKFAAFLQKKFNDAPKNIIFLSGGAYGFHEEILARADFKLSLSEMTFTHQMVRLIFLEQLYRAMTILRNEPYHH